MAAKGPGTGGVAGRCRGIPKTRKPGIAARPGESCTAPAVGQRRVLDEYRELWAKESRHTGSRSQAADDLPRVKLTTTKGEITIELFENEAPQSVANFLTLVKQGFYNGSPFHRVLPKFMAQGGAKTGGRGGRARAMQFAANATGRTIAGIFGER